MDTNGAITRREDPSNLENNLGLFYGGPYLQVVVHSIWLFFVRVNR
jgi:hypothetical protein